VTPEELVAGYGSPLYVYDLDRLRAARAQLRRALPEPFTLFYSLKANPHPRIAAALREGDGGCRAEVCSAGELAAALDAGFPAREILYGGPGKTAAELAAACRLGVRRFSLESLGDARRVGAVATGQGIEVDCLLRINAENAAAGTSIRMTGAPSQFGIDAEALPEVLPVLLAVPGIRVTGLHFFPLSNGRDEESIVAEFLQSIATAAQISQEHGVPVDFLDLGGGFAAPYSVPGPLPVYRKLRGELERGLDLHFPGWRDGAPRVGCESGRYLAGSCGELLTTVTNVKHSRGRRFVVLDAGINTLGGMAGLGRLLPLAVAVDGDPPTERATLAGPLCTPGDLLGRDVAVPELAPGDVVRVPNLGAYGLTASLVTFLSRPAPAEVFLDGGEVVAATRLETRRVPLHAEA
jgi:diaminopimelate decarboxylase